jgi:PPOX class probable F420-dependent enzyme
MPLPDGLLELLNGASPCFVATVNADGSPQLTQTWVTTDGEHVVINTPDWTQKARNVARDPRVALNIVDPEDTRRYVAVRGHVVSVTDDGGTESIDQLSNKYLGIPYPNFSGREETRLVVTIAVDSVLGIGG